MKDNERRVVLVTGASSGIGAATAELMAKDGDIVYGTSRRAKGESVRCGEHCYTMLPLTMEDEQTISDAVDGIIAEHGRIDVLVNAAGSGIAGAIEETDMDETRSQFEVCFTGIVGVQNCVLPHMRRAGSGMIINVGSMASIFPVPYQGMYSAVKSALLMMTSTLRMEVRPFGIRACVIEPGDTKTGFTEKRVFSRMSAKTAYKQPLERALYEMIRSELSSPGPQKCARMILQTSKRANPPVRRSVGGKYKLFYIASRLLPLRLKETVIKMIYLSQDPPPGAVWTYNKHFKEKK